MQTKVIYHANCPDGFASSWVLHKYLNFKNDLEFIPLNYGQDVPNLQDARVYVVDFSFKKAVMERVLKEVHSLCIIDHHVTAEKELADFESCTYDEWVFNEKKLFIKFDMQHSGCVLAWRQFFPSIVPPWPLLYIEDRDLWQFVLPQSKEINIAMSSYETSYENFYTWAHDCDEKLKAELAQQGVGILRYQDQLVKRICNNAVKGTVLGTPVLIVNTCTLISEVGGELAKTQPFGASWFRRADGKLQWSLRSVENGVDVSEIAKKLGGGGHRHAAGFTQDTMILGNV